MYYVEIDVQDSGVETFREMTEHESSTDATQKAEEELWFQLDPRYGPWQVVRDDEYNDAYSATLVTMTSGDGNKVVTIHLY